MEDALLLTLITLIHRNGGTITFSDEEAVEALAYTGGIKPYREDNMTTLVLTPKKEPSVH